MSGWRQAFSLSKSTVATAVPPGTVQLTDVKDESTDIELVPTPSSKPEDPLNWPTWRKHAVLWVLTLFTFQVNVTSSIVSSAVPILAHTIYPPQPQSKLTQLISVNVLMIGASNIIWVPLSNIFGRRLILVISSLACTFFAVWGGEASTFSSLLASRALLGFAGGPSETVAPATIGEMFFVHQRGAAMAIYTGGLAIGSFMGGLIGGYVAGREGPDYIFWIPTALAAGSAVLIFLLVPETLFDRGKYLPTSLVGHQQPQLEHTGEKYATTDIYPTVSAEPFLHGRPVVEGKMSFGQALRMGAYHGHVFSHFIKPWLTLRLPGTWMVALHYGGLVGGVVTMSTIGPVLLSMPPYLWGENAGLFNFGAIIGGFLGALFTYFITDRLLIRSSKKHQMEGGLAEPENRLPAMFPGLFLAVTGMWTFGFSAGTHAPAAWGGLVVGYGMLSFGLIQVPAVGYSYLIDSYGQWASSCFVMNALSRAVVGFAWTFFVADWVLSAGPAEPFGIFGMLMAIFALLTVPVWLYGKRMRIATAGYL